jgi:hypothetical protein
MLEEENSFYMKHMPKFENFVVIDLNGLTSQFSFTESLDAIKDLDSHYTMYDR